MKTIGKLAVQAIHSFEDAPQEFINTEVLVPVVGLGMSDLTNVEIDVIEQILTNALAEDNVIPLNELAKISLCYTTPPSADAVQSVFRFLIRNGAKYYFQPNQADFVESAIMERMPNVASDTKAFA